MRLHKTDLREEAIKSIITAQRVLVLTGAGMSAESGIPTFRQAQTGMWSKFDPQELATPEAFAQNPGRVWDWYCWRRELINQSSPHAGYASLVQWQKLHGNISIATQNVDGLHQAAGSDGVIELHGNIMRTICSETLKPIEADWLLAHPGSPVRSPHSPDAWARPAVTWFGESLPLKALNEAQDEALKADVVLSIGTSALVHPAASLPVTALERGAKVYEINPEPTALSQAMHYRFEMTASEALGMIFQRALSLSGE